MTQPAPPPLFCANHPDRETLLRCNRCEKPICYQCAVRCRECVRAQQAKYYNGESYDLPLGTLIAVVLGAAFGALAYLFLGMVGFFSFIIAFIAGPAAGGAVAEVIRRLLRKRRVQGMKIAAVAAFVVGVLAAGLFLVGFPGMFLRLSVILFGVVAASTLYARIL